MCLPRKITNSAQNVLGSKKRQCPLLWICHWKLEEGCLMTRCQSRKLLDSRAKHFKLKKFKHASFRIDNDNDPKWWSILNWHHWTSNESDNWENHETRRSLKFWKLKISNMHPIYPNVFTIATSSRLHNQARKIYLALFMLSFAYTSFHTVARHCMP